MLSKKNILILGAGAALAVLLVLTQTAWTDQGQGHYKLGGGWIGKGAGTVWTCLVTPLNPEAQAGAVHVKFQLYDTNMAALITAFGGDTVSEFIGEGEMINRDTDKWTLVGYIQKQGNPPQITAIWVVSGTWKFINPDQAVLKYTSYVYLPGADADHDGLPDPGTTPVLTVPNLTDTARRVPNGELADRR